MPHTAYCIALQTPAVNLPQPGVGVTLAGGAGFQLMVPAGGALAVLSDVAGDLTLTYRDGSQVVVPLPAGPLMLTLGSVALASVAYASATGRVLLWDATNSQQTNRSFTKE